MALPESLPFTRPRWGSSMRPSLRRRTKLHMRSRWSTLSTAVPMPEHYRSTGEWSTVRILNWPGAFFTGREEPRMTSEVVHPVPEGFHGRMKPDDLDAMRDSAERDPDAFWLEQANRLDWFDRAPAGRRLVVRRGGFPHPLVCGRQAQPVGQLPRPPPGKNGDRTAVIFEADEPGEGRRSPIASFTKRPAASPIC
jgi:hypothetical protein